MLTYLRINNLALIEAIALELGPGLTVFTGETGAGKSILLDGLALVCGTRAALDQVRTGTPEATIEAEFDDVIDRVLTESLAAAGVSVEDGKVVVRRSLTPSGSRAYLNDRLVTVQRLESFGGRLVDIAGQHEQQSLRRVHTHGLLLDRYAVALELVDEVAAAFDAALDCHQHIEGLRAEARTRARQQDYLRFQLDEIRSADLQIEEAAELARERRRLVHAEDLAAAANEALALLYEGDAAAVMLLGVARRRIEVMRQLDPDLPLRLEALEDAAVSVEDLGRELQSYLESIHSDPQRLAEVEQRLAVIDGLRRKYGDTVEEILETAFGAEEQLRSLDRADSEIDVLKSRLKAESERYRQAAEQLSACRKTAAAALEKRVDAELHQVGMQGARFVVDIRTADSCVAADLPPGASRRGAERIEFLLTANPGEMPRELARVASGGELSRVLLALKLVVGEKEPATTLVFDEVDAGIGGGEVAERLAQRLARLARRHQLLVVTHLPQIAAYADQHVGVRKTASAGRSEVRVELLGGAARVDELARMLGGLEITETTREHAREMLGSRV